MKKHSVPLLLGAVALLAGCGAARDVALQDTGGTPEPAPVGAPSPRPSEAPWPAYDVDDYTYTLRTSCFCADRGVAVVVTVRDGVATDAVYARAGSDHAAGDSAGDWLRVTINDIIDAANTKGAYQVRVRWPQDQPYPASVWVDRDANTADEEIGYSVRDVTPS